MKDKKQTVSIETIDGKEVYEVVLNTWINGDYSSEILYQTTCKDEAEDLAYEVMHDHEIDGKPEYITHFY